MRRFWSAVVLCCTLGLVAAAPPPSPPRGLPLVVVYPFDVSSDLQAGIGLHAAELFVQQMNRAGGVDALTAPPSIKRAQYLTYALKLKADYYVAGYMTPLGNGVSLVEQVVATQSGTIIFAQTAQIESLADAAAQAVTIRDGIVDRERSLNASIAQSETQSTPAPLANNQANLSGFARSIFHRGAKAVHTPPPHVVKPAKGIFLAKAGGSAPAKLLAIATTDLFYDLKAHFHVRMTTVAQAAAAKQANAICGNARDNTVATGTLGSTSVRHGLFTRAQYTFTLLVYTCFGDRLATATGSGGSVARAVDAAVLSFAKAHPLND